MTYFDETLTLDPITEQQSTPILPEERHVFELIGFERSEPDQWRKEGGVKWTFRVFQEDGRTPFVFNDEQYLFFRTTNVDKRTGKPLFTVGYSANDWASALLGRTLGVDAHFQVSELRGKRMSAMVTWKRQVKDKTKWSVELASLRHVPVGQQPAGTAPAMRAQHEAEAAADQAIYQMDHHALVEDLKIAVKTAKKFGVPEPTIATFQAVIDDAGSASVDQLKAILENVKSENAKALDS